MPLGASDWSRKGNAVGIEVTALSTAEAQKEFRASTHCQCTAFVSNMPSLRGGTVVAVAAEKTKSTAAAEAAAQAQLEKVSSVEIAGITGAVGQEYNGVYHSQGVNWNGWPRFASAQGLQLFRCVAGTQHLIKRLLSQ